MYFKSLEIYFRHDNHCNVDSLVQCNMTDAGKDDVTNEMVGPYIHSTLDDCDQLCLLSRSRWSTLWMSRVVT